MTNQIDVLIIGAGPTGLTLACELLRRGIQCRLVEKAAAHTKDSKAISIYPRTLELLDLLGVADALIARGKPVPYSNVYANGRRLAYVDFGHLDTPYPYVLNIPQSTTEAELGRKFQQLGGTIEWEHALKTIVQKPDAVHATVENSEGDLETIHAKWVVGCDGARSTVREQLAAPLEGHSYPMSFMVADSCIEWAGNKDDNHIFFTRDGYLVIAPLPNGLHRIAVEIPGDQREDLFAPELEVFQALLDQRGPGGIRLYDPFWLTKAKAHHRMVNQYRFGRIFLAGDAAHLHSPVGGQGMNTSIQDSFNLGWKLALVLQGHAPDRLLDTYHEERHAAGKDALARTDNLNRIYTLKNPIASWVRDRIGPIVTNLDKVKKSLPEKVSGTNLNYRTSSLSTELPAAGQPPNTLIRAGDRVPDVALMDSGGGAPQSLFELLRAPQQRLLIFVPASLTAEVNAAITTIVTKIKQDYQAVITVSVVVPRLSVSGAVWDEAVLLDMEQAIQTRFGVADGGLYLVRPDGYVGFMSQLIRPNALFAHLSQHFLQSPTYAQNHVVAGYAHE